RRPLPSAAATKRTAKRAASAAARARRRRDRHPRGPRPRDLHTAVPASAGLKWQTRDDDRLERLDGRGWSRRRQRRGLVERPSPATSAGPYNERPGGRARTVAGGRRRLAHTATLGGEQALAPTPRGGHGARGRRRPYSRRARRRTRAARRQRPRDPHLEAARPTALARLPARR